MQSDKWMAGLLLSLMTACSVAQGSNPEDNAPAVSETTAADCPGHDFNRFLSAFIDGIEVQRAFTVLPLRDDSLDAEAEPEPHVVTKMMSASDLQFPVIPSIQQQREQELTMSSHPSGSEMVVTLAKPDSDYQMSYYFRRGACWRLYRKSDESI